MTTTTINRDDTLRGVAPRFLPELFGRIADAVVTHVNRRRAEHQLEALDDRLLADIGVSRSDIHGLIWGKK